MLINNGCKAIVEGYKVLRGENNVIIKFDAGSYNFSHDSVEYYKVLRGICEFYE